MSPSEHDTALAALYHDLAKARQLAASADAKLYRMAGAQTMYSGSSRSSAFWGMQRRVDGRVETLRVTEAVRDQLLSEMDPHERQLRHGGTVAQAQDALADRQREADAVRETIAEMEQGYTGWSRFFLVTSSAGHIHSSMHCSTCRPSTTYGWLPELSGQTVVEAIDAHGPALCSVCFPSAPVEWTGAKITAAKAAKVAA